MCIYIDFPNQPHPGNETQILNMRLGVNSENSIVELKVHYANLDEIISVDV